jgi:hypothetical protein
MYISGLGVIEKNREKKKSAKTSAGGFSELISDTQIEESGAANTPAVSSTSSLFFLQEVGDEAKQKKEAVAQGFDAIKYLDDIRAGLLMGTLSKDTIAGLETILERFRKNFSDPKLSEIIDEIELRAKVEIAKLGGNQ